MSNLNTLAILTLIELIELEYEENMFRCEMLLLESLALYYYELSLIFQAEDALREQILLTACAFTNYSTLSTTQFLLDVVNILQETQLLEDLPDIQSLTQSLFPL